MDKKDNVEEIYETLLRRIICLEYSPGQVLNEMDITNDFNLNRVQVRALFQQLRDKNFLIVLPRYGAQVSLIDFRYMKSVFEVIRILESYATKIAVEKISDSKIMELEGIVERIKDYNIETDFKTIISEDEKFHKIIIESTQNHCLKDTLFYLKLHTERLWFYFQQDLSDINLFYQTLSSIVEVLKIRNTEKAELAAREHIDDFVDLIKTKLL